MLRAIFPQATFISKEPAIHAPVNLQSLELISEVAALIDSGATNNFISLQVISVSKSGPVRFSDRNLRNRNRNRLP